MTSTGAAADDQEGAPPPPLTPNVPSKGRTSRKWLIGALLVLVLVTLLCSLSLSTITAEGPAKRSLRHSVAMLAEVDSYLDTHFAPLQEEARATQQEALTLPDFPLRLTFSPEEILASERTVFRALLLERAAAQLYEDGTSALRDEREASGSFFSAQGVVRQVIDLMREDLHNVFRVTTITLAIFAALLALALALETRGYGRLAGLGASLSSAAIPFLISALALRLVIRQSADSQEELFTREFLRLVQELLWAPTRIGVIFSLGGLLFLAAGISLARWSDRRHAYREAVSFS